MNKLHFITYNNYFNRKFKIESNIADYPSGYTPTKTQDFNPNDGLYTTHVIGTSNIKNFVYDYLLVCNEYNTQIESRWFIIGKERIRGGQWKLTLKRDILVDKASAFENAQAIIERGHVNSDNPLIFNKENFNFNQIKKEEILLKDETKIPWIVAYIPTDTQAFSDEPLQLKLNEDSSLVVVSELPKPEGEYYSYPTGWRYNVHWTNGGEITSAYRNMTTIVSGIGNLISTTMNVAQTSEALKHSYVENTNLVSLQIQQMLIGAGLSELNDKVVSYLKNIRTKQLSKTEDETIQSLNGKIIFNSDDNKYYKVNVRTEDAYEYEEYLISSITTPDLFSEFNTLIDNSNIFDSYEVMSDSSIKLGVRTYKRVISYEEVTYRSTATMSLSANRTKCANGLYDIIAIPCGSVNIYDQNGTALLTTDEYTSKSAAITLGSKLSGSIYDIQLLPYCPIQSKIKSNASGQFEGVTIDTTKEGREFSYIKNSGTNVGVILYIQNNEFTFDINQPIELYKEEYLDVENPYTINTIDIQTNTDNWRMIATPSSLYPPIEPTPPSTRDIGFTFNHPIDVLEIDKITKEVTNTFRTQHIGFRVTLPYAFYSVLFDDRQITKAELEIGDYYYCFNLNGQYSEIQYSSLDQDTVKSWMCQIMVGVNNIPLDAALSTKIDAECDMYRLVSPNYQGQFEFCVAKNGGVEYFNVDVTLRPGNPYIHVNPNFKLMYGSDYNDARGLICSGDFSFGQLTSNWEQYQLQNKNYEAMFNRQIQSMDVEHKIQKQEALFGLIAGGMGGTSSSAMSGALIGGPAGAIVGGAVGGVASTIGGVMDYTNLKKRQEEQKDLAIDMHQFQLDNIQALPYSLTKCPAFTFNNKIFPFVERYSASDEEIKAFKHYLNLRSFNLNVVGVVRDYIGPTETFIKGQIIRLEGINEDSAIAQEIYDEFNKGVYIE